MTSRWSLVLVGVGMALSLAAPADADLSKKVIAAFKGQVIVTDAPVEPSEDDKVTIAEFKKARLKEVKGTPSGDDVTAWRFNYTAFLKKGGAANLRFEFVTADKEKRFAADKRLVGVDPSAPALSGELEITEDDGLAKGKSYTLNLTANVKGKDTVVATTTVTMK